MFGGMKRNNFSSGAGDDDRRPLLNKGHVMKKFLILGAALLAASACTPVGMAADAAITTGQVALGVADLVI